jgi:hypothetical protein
MVRVKITNTKNCHNSIQLLVIIVVLLSIVFPAASCETKNNPSKMLHVKAILNLGDDYLTAGSSVCAVQIINEDTFDWHNVTLRVDEFYVYKEKFDVIKAGDALTLPLTGYLLDNTPFDITKYKPYKVGVTADEGNYFYGWAEE